MHLSAFKYGPPKTATTRTQAKGAQTVSADVRAAVAALAAQQAERQAAARAAPIRLVERAGVFRYFDPSRTFTPGAEERAQSKAWREGRLDIPLYTPDSHAPPDYSVIVSDTKPEDEIMQEANTAGLNKRVLAQAQFLTWLQNRFPELASAVMNDTGPTNLSGLGVHQASTPITPTVTQPDTFTSILDKIATVGGTYILLSAQRKIIDMNIERAKIGLPPIDIAAAGAAPVVQTEVNLSPEVLDSLRQSLGGGFQQIGLFIAIGLGAFLLFSRK